MDALYTFADGDNHLVSSTFEHRWIAPFLVLSWIVIGLVLMSYATAVMFDEYIDKQRDLVHEAQQEQQLNLFAAFATITKDRYEVQALRLYAAALSGREGGTDEAEAVAARLLGLS